MSPTPADMAPDPTSCAPPLSFVDSHHHLQDLVHNSYPWLTDLDAPAKLGGDLAPLRRNYLVDDLRDDLSGVKLIKSVHVQNGWDPKDPVGETRWLQRIAEKRGTPSAIVAYADLSRPDIAETLEAHSAYANVRGIRQILNWHENPYLTVLDRPDLMEDASWRRGFAMLRRFDMSFDLQIYASQMDKAAALGRRLSGHPSVAEPYGYADRRIA